ncbi:probable mitochondrial-processing peptidase subunit beta, mitochondrial [Chenopodium quinoa]|uniref:probable mitochondrial-processing peptidase subunit beta, mitochondrial n=1 Tax=Chenopodium quinoa TaxID=63459 RepID=UPI000B777D4F|nr:probable mitochondrial-processing peptidase subunit beta, mitochondrial [Chenopodium quinoa]
MSTRKLIHHSLRRTHHHPSTVRHHATLSPSPAPPPPSTPSPPPPTAMIYDRLAESVKSKLKTLQNPDPRFLRYTSPHPISADHSQILQFPATQITTLPNGLRVVTESRLASGSGSVGVYLDSGSRFESDEKNGVGSFLERVVLTSDNEDAANIGAELEGFTGREISGFLGKVAAQNSGKLVEVFGSLLQNSDFSDEKIEKVRNAILREKELMGVEGDQVIMDQLHATAFQYTPLGKTISGSVDTIKSITKADIQDYMSSHCAAHRMVISASGGVKHEEVVEQVKKVFTKLSANPITTSQLVASDPVNFTGSEVRMINDDLPLARFAVAFEGASCKDPDAIALMVVQTMLGSWSKMEEGGKHVGSELVQRTSINEIAESIKTFNINYKDTGLFGVYALAQPDCLDDLSYAIMHVISKLSYRVSEEDVIRARNQLKSSLLAKSNGISRAAEDVGQQLLTYGRRIPFAELFARIDAVDASAVKRAADRFLFDKDIAIAAMGPIKKLPDYNWFRRRTYWLRY